MERKRDTKNGEENKKEGSDKRITRLSPGHHDEEVHDVPDVA